MAAKMNPAGKTGGHRENYHVLHSQKGIFGL
jgi:hypothetical protein